MRTANPALNKNTFLNLRHTAEYGAMTLNGTVNKSFIMIILLAASAAFAWQQASAFSAAMPLFLYGGIFAAFVVALITIFKKEWAPVTAPIYAVLEGFALGVISLFFERLFPGIVFQAVALTFGTLFCLLFAYKSGWIKATENFRLGVFAATGAVALIYFISIIMGFFGTTIPFIHESGAIGIGFSLVVVVIAALNLVLDFDFIEQGVHHGAPKYMEWYASFGLMVTLVWLYLEMLRLLSKLRSRN